MKKLKISIQDGLQEVTDKLKDAGHEVFHFGEGGLHADVTIITGVDSEYEEINNSQIMKNGPDECMLVINATGMNPDQVLAEVNRKGGCQDC